MGILGEAPMGLRKNWGKCKRRRREAAIAEALGKKPLTTRGLGGVVSSLSGVSGGAPESEAILNILFQNGVHFWILLISNLARGPNYVMGIWGEAPMGLRESRGKCKRRRREAAIAEGKKPLTTRGSGERRKLPSGFWGSAPETEAILNILFQNGIHFGILLISHLARGAKLCNWDLGRSPNGVKGTIWFRG